MTDEPSALPVGVQLLWGQRTPSRRGPKPAFTLDEVVAAAIAIADEEGLAAVSMARVADQLGSSTMALYRYVTSKDDLLLLMGDAAVGAPPVFRGRREWRSRLRNWALAVRAVWWQRPWLLELPVSGPPAGPNNLLWFDACLAAVEDTPLDDAERIGAVLLVSTYVRGANAGGSRPGGGVGDRSGERQPQLRPAGGTRRPRSFPRPVQDDRPWDVRGRSRRFRR